VALTSYFKKGYIYPLHYCFTMICYSNGSSISYCYVFTLNSKGSLLGGLGGAGLAVFRSLFMKTVPVALYFFMMSLTVDGLMCSFLPAYERDLPSMSTNLIIANLFFIPKCLPSRKSAHISASGGNRLACWS
jgi:hypothetical protein